MGVGVLLSLMAINQACRKPTKMDLKQGGANNPSKNLLR